MSLFSRIVTPSETEAKISIHAIQSMLSELNAGRITPADIITMLELNAAEQADLNTFLTKVNSATDKLGFSSRVFNFLCLGEMGYTSPYDYTDEANFWAMVDNEAV